MIEPMVFDYKQKNEFIEFITDNIDEIDAIKYCLEEGNSHDENWQFMYIVCDNDFEVNDKPSLYVSAPIVEHIDKSELLKYVKANKYELFRHSYFERVKVYLSSDVK